MTGRERAFTAVTFVLAAALLWAAAEGALRVRERLLPVLELRRLPPVESRCLVPSEDPRFPHVLRPGFRKGAFSVNAAGMADVERSPKKGPGTLRVACVGDSITCGFDLLPPEDGYPRRLETALRDRIPRLEVLNFGVNGYGLRDSLEVARLRVPRFAPDVVVAQICLNDPYTTDSPYGLYTPASGSRVARQVRRLIDPARFQSWAQVERAWDDQGRRNLREALQGLGDLGRSGRPVLAVLFPATSRLAYDRWGYGAYHRFVAEEAAAAGLPLIDLREAFERAGLLAEGLQVDLVHPDARGHRLAAEAIARELELRGWLAAGSR